MSASCGWTTVSAVLSAFDHLLELLFCRTGSLPMGLPFYTTKRRRTATRNVPTTLWAALLPLNRYSTICSVTNPPGDQVLGQRPIHEREHPYCTTGCVVCHRTDA
ncbi:hypothetical protein K402DRAFT_389327 [Aulographum hederae CBS 113979]|uniref:Secreted protein n=1 Tax=Aulographum hederae CBS 113979 TaxID=1176131 RepID=A0A6G1HDW5_9PEZI|nr:hypothetical protein K402DRAFT_389327 [Aulographum hederae CBS 113979]